MAAEKTSLHGLWTSKWAFMFATAGAAVGLGNIWKFPYIAGVNGGGAFVLMYLGCVVILGIPIMIAEVMIGRRGRRNPAFAIADIATESGHSSLWGLVGYLIILAGFLILSYYSVIAGWALDYVFKAGQGLFVGKNALAIDSLYSHLVSAPWQLLLWHTIIMIATIFVIARGVQKGIEKAIYLMFPTFIILLLIIIGYAIDTGFFGKGLHFLFHPDFAKLSGKNMLVALGHAFFTLSLATGSIMMYGAYLPKDISIAKVSLFVAFADTLVALMAGLAIYPLVFAHGLEPGAGVGLIFKTLPLAFGRMSGGTLIGILFFIMLVFAAFTSAISLLEPTVAWMMERLNWSRLKAAIVSGFVIWVLGIGTVLSFNHWQDYKIFGFNFFEFVDYLTSNIMLPLGGLLITIFAVWIMKKQFVEKELGAKGGVLFYLWYVGMRFIVPIAIIIVLLNALGIF